MMAGLFGALLVTFDYYIISFFRFRNGSCLLYTLIRPHAIENAYNVFAKWRLLYRTILSFFGATFGIFSFQSAVVSVYLHCIQNKLLGALTQPDNLITSLSICIVLILEILNQYQFILKLLCICNFRSHAFVNLRTRINNFVNSTKTLPSLTRHLSFLYVIDCLIGYFTSASM